MKNIDSVLIPSGPSENVDLQRAKGALRYFGANVHYTILGAGPDIYEAIKYQNEKKEIPKNLDHHIALYNFIASRVAQEKLELITPSTTAVQNFLEFFKNDRKGNYIISSDYWQIMKYLHIYRVLQKKGKISKEVNLGVNVVDTEEYYNWFRKLLSKAKTELELRKI